MLRPTLARVRELGAVQVQVAVQWFWRRPETSAHRQQERLAPYPASLVLVARLVLVPTFSLAAAMPSYSLEPHSLELLPS